VPHLCESGQEWTEHCLALLPHDWGRQWLLDDSCYRMCQRERRVFRYLNCESIHPSNSMVVLA